MKCKGLWTVDGWAVVIINSLSPGAPTPPEMLLNRGDKLLTFDGWEEWRLVAQRCLEMGHTGGRRGKAVMSIFNPRQLLAPGWLVSGYQAPESRLELLVGTLHLAIGLWVETGGETDLSSEGVEELFPDPWRELSAPCPRWCPWESHEDETRG